MLDLIRSMTAATLIAMPMTAYAQAAAAETEAEETPQTAEEAPDPEAEAIKEMRQELEKLQTQYQLMQQRQKNALAQSELEKQEIAAKAALREARQNEELAAMRADAARLEAEAAKLRAEQGLRDAQRKNELDDIQATIQTRQTRKQLEDLDKAEEMRALREQSERLSLENSMAAHRLTEAQTRLQITQSEYQERVASLEGDLRIRETKDKASDRVTSDVEYREDPFDGHTLHVTDRRIPLNGPIWTGTADYVTERIHFFNNKSSDPIFIVIDNCPGGSVMEGYRIVKAIESSPAPVHVVVKSFAASMAAVITTLADHSYAYPNAIVLHHQMSSGMFGNLTQQKEQLEESFEWARRLAEPVAEKMGLTYDQLTAKMYENNSDGDWAEFADEAVKLKWVNTIVHEIREAGVRDRPTSDRWALPFFFQMMEEDDEGERYIRMPPLQPFDHYFMYDPTNFYRVE